VERYGEGAPVMAAIMRRRNGLMEGDLEGYGVS
jgi:hypothetical protein